ncbi:MAG: MBL fold metallo-hydrolase [Chloroflexota bacterium]
MKTLFEGVHMLEGEINGRFLQLIYLRGETASVLLDTGCTNDPDKFIVPQMREAGGDPATLTWIIDTHPDLDHTGGNHVMKQNAPAAMLACGDPDREACASGANLLRLRYETFHADHQIYYTGDTLAWVKAESGTAEPIALTFVGGEHLRLSDDWVVEVLSVPGHAKGHLAILDEKNKALYAADALHGSACIGFDGTAKLCPTYWHVDDYLNTIRFIEHLPIITYVGCHWPIKRGTEIAEFCDESRRFVTRTDTLLLDLLKQPQSLRDICLTLGPQLGDWDHTPAMDLELVSALYGHVARLLDRWIIVEHVRQTNPRILEYVRS